MDNYGIMGVELLDKGEDNVDYTRLLIFHLHILYLFCHLRIVCCIQSFKNELPIETNYKTPWRR